MCILFFALKQHPQYPVIICANRDEFHQRPSKSMHYWDTEVRSTTKGQSEKILAGKDLQAGGTWLGLTSQGRFSALTNFRQGTANNKINAHQPVNADLANNSAENSTKNSAKNNEKKSRGHLVLQALAKSNQQLIQQLATSSSNYNGFNLVFGELDNLHIYDSVNQKFSQLTSGIHSLCNGTLDDIWPKMALGQQQLISMITNNDKLSIEQLFNLMKNAQQAKPEQLPNTGIPEEWEQFLSSIFIVSPQYGTRTTTIITQDNNGVIAIADRSYNESGECVEQQKFVMPIPY
ncbi:MAG: NRDE family protein [Alteromonadaceae bacterium]|nr:NRDE family protein [Alteromonadaceae bacterium]